MRVWLTVALLVLIPALSAADAKQEFQAIYSKLAEFAREKDVEKSAKYLDETFTASINGRHLTRVQYIQTRKSYMADVKSIKTSAKVTSATIKGTEAIVICDVETTLTIAPKGKPHKAQNEETRQDVWVRRAVGWRLKHFQVLKAQLLIDGKRMSQPGS